MALDRFLRDRTGVTGGDEKSVIAQPSTAAYFETLSSNFESAISSSPGLEERHYSIAGLRLRFQFAGPALVAPLTTAFEHLACEPDPLRGPDFTVCVWDSESTDSSPPSPAWTPDDHRERGEIRGFCDERFHTFYQLYTRRLTMVDWERSTALCWTRCPRSVPVSERGAPFRVLLEAWLAREGLIMLHSGATGNESGGVLLVGAGGSGKSNTSLTCLQSDLLYVGDDYCVIRCEDPVTAHSLYQSAKLYPSDRSRYPSLDDPALWYQDETSDKALAFLKQILPDKLVPSLPISAILLPRVTEEKDTRISRASPRVALKSIMLGAMPPPMGGMTGGLTKLSSLARSVPSFELQLGTQRAQIPDTIKKLLKGGTFGGSPSLSAASET